MSWKSCLTLLIAEWYCRHQKLPGWNPRNLAQDSIERVLSEIFSLNFRAVEFLKGLTILTILSFGRTREENISFSFIYSCVACWGEIIQGFVQQNPENCSTNLGGGRPLDSTDDSNTSSSRSGCPWEIVWIREDPRKTNLQLYLPVWLAEDLFLVGKKKWYGSGFQLHSLVQVGEDQNINNLEKYHLFYITLVLHSQIMTTE